MDKPNYNLLTEDEAAERLGCSFARIRYLRRSGKLRHIRGRPVLILERDLLEYQEERAAKLRAKLGPEPGTPEYDEEQSRRTCEAARRAWIIRRCLEEMKRGR